MTDRARAELRPQAVLKGLSGILSLNGGVMMHLPDQPRRGSTDQTSTEGKTFIGCRANPAGCRIARSVFRRAGTGIALCRSSDRAPFRVHGLRALRATAQIEAAVETYFCSLQCRADELERVVACPFGRTAHIAEFATGAIDEQRRRHAERLAGDFQILKHLGVRVGVLGAA